jgi:hypothetical protein
VIRAHGRATVQSGEQRTDAPSVGATLNATRVARPVPVVGAEATLSDVLQALGSSRDGAVAVRRADGTIEGAIVLEQMRELLGHDDLSRMLVAADLARPLAEVAPEANLAALCRSCARDDLAGCRVADGGHAPRLVTSAMLGSALIHGYAEGGLNVW